MAARIANAAWAVRRDRLADGHRVGGFRHQDDLDARLERIEAAIYALFRRLDEDRP